MSVWARGAQPPKPSSWVYVKNFAGIFGRAFLVIQDHFRCASRRARVTHLVFPGRPGIPSCFRQSSFMDRMFRDLGQWTPIPRDSQLTTWQRTSAMQIRCLETVGHPCTPIARVDTFLLMRVSLRYRRARQFSILSFLTSQLVNLRIPVILLASFFLQSPTTWLCQVIRKLNPYRFTLTNSEIGYLITFRLYRVPSHAPQLDHSCTMPFLERQIVLLSPHRDILV